MKPQLVTSLTLFLVLGACTAEQAPNEQAPKEQAPNTPPKKTPEQQPASQPTAKADKGDESAKPAEASAKKPEAKETPKAKETKVENVDAAGAAQLIASDASILILDIRRPSEYARGHIKDAVLITWGNDDFEEKLDKLDKSKTCLIH